MSDQSLHARSAARRRVTFSQSGRPFIKSCRLRGLTGSVEVDVVDTAVPSLFGCASESELKEHVRAQSLTSVRQRMNVRGVLREEGGGSREYTLQWQMWRR